jgi:1-acyl-sn-glycerol-3-phosphate acyltransferase
MKPHKIQEFAGRIAVILVAPLYILYLRMFMGYRIRDIKRLRREWKDLLREHEGPWLICPNHLTMIDSLIATYGLLSLYDHILHFERVPWNLPERKNFQRWLILTVLCYLAKCLPISRGGDREEMIKTMAACHDLLEAKQHLLVYPEGGRSRTGRINEENYSYGIGRFIAEHPGCRVLCVYLRGDNQETYSNFPPREDRFTMMIRAFVPVRTDMQGLRAQRDYAGQVIQQLSLMEEDYFTNDRQRHRRFDGAREPGQESERTFSQPRLHA